MLLLYKNKLVLTVELSQSVKQWKNYISCSTIITMHTNELCGTVFNYIKLPTLINYYGLIVWQWWKQTLSFILKCILVLYVCPFIHPCNRCSNHGDRLHFHRPKIISVQPFWFWFSLVHFNGQLFWLHFLHCTHVRSLLCPLYLSDEY